MEHALPGDVVTLAVRERGHRFDETGLFQYHINQAMTVGVIWCPVGQRLYVGTIIEALEPGGKGRKRDIPNATV